VRNKVRCVRNCLAFDIDLQTKPADKGRCVRNSKALDAVKGRCVHEEQSSI